MFVRLAAVLSLAASLLCPAPIRADNVVINIDAAKAGPKVSPNLYGIFLEEINHGVDGGLYAELIRNRGFEDARPPEGYTLRNGVWRNPGGFDAGYTRFGYARATNGLPFWELVQSGGAKGTMNLETNGGVTEQSAYCLRLDVEETAGGRFGIANLGFFGIGIRQGEKYTLSLYARGDSFNGPLSVRLEDASGAACSSEASVRNIPKGWKQFTATLTASKTENKARLVITAGAKGRVWLDFVSMFPARTWKGRPNGMRPDLAQMIADLKPGFVRFPGGCVVEGGTVETAYDWKLTVGPLTKREERWGPWMYRQTHGMGLHEYFQFIEDLGAEPLWVGFDGQTCIFRSPQVVPMTNMGPVLDNFLDVIEYANGSTRTKWGAMRAEAGHRQPFDLKYVEIGNENQGQVYNERYKYVHDVLKPKHPDIKYLVDLSWTSRAVMRDAVFDIEDRHHYSNPNWFISQYRGYDKRDRNIPPLYLGELAVTSNDGGPTRGNLLAALSEGVFLMGCERNSDVVSMVSYAPLLGHVEGRTELVNAPPPWHAMIYFDGTRAYGTVSYHLWKLFGASRPDHTVQTDLEYPGAKPIVVAGQIGLGTFVGTAEFKDVKVEKGGQVVYSSDFTQGTEGWQTGGRGGGGGQRAGGAQWSVVEGAYRQGRAGRASSYYGQEDWSDYTLTLKARKLSGNEGFLITFGRKGNDMLWWNLGGWGNTQHGVEHSISGNQTPVGEPVQGRLESNRWYDVKVQLEGGRVRCYLDDKLVHDVVVPKIETFFATAGREDASGDVILKAINMSTNAVAATLNISGAKRLASQADVTVLTAGRLQDNNSLDEPMKVVPVTSKMPVAGAAIAREFPANSLTVIRLKAR